MNYTHCGIFVIYGFFINTIRIYWRDVIEE